MIAENDELQAWIVEKESQIDEAKKMIEELMKQKREEQNTIQKGISHSGARRT